MGGDPKIYHHNPSHINRSCIGICIGCIGHIYIYIYISHAQSIMKPLVATRFHMNPGWGGNIPRFVDFQMSKMQYKSTPRNSTKNPPVDPPVIVR